MSLLEGEVPPSGKVRKELNVADRRATALAGLGLCLTLAAIAGLPGPDAWFMGLAPALGILSCGAALLGVFLERFRGGWARLFLTLGAVALAAAGIGWLHSANPLRVIAAYLAPAALFFAAAGALHGPRLRARAT
jgi:peptidoglycan/LPS O-acetylase OafA/YrhL